MQRELLMAMKASERDEATSQIALACAKLANSLAESRLGWAAAMDTKRAMPILMLVIRQPFGALEDHGSCSTRSCG